MEENRRALRHAYLIITHGSFPILEKQLRFLDSENADFFIHLDPRVTEFDFDHYRAIPQKSGVTFVERVRISWGDYSQVECEMNLLKAAGPGHYDYYHFLSGVDVPVKSRAYIESYFLRAPGTNYLNLKKETLSPLELARVRYYHPFQRWNIRNRPLRRALRLASYVPQLLAGINRTRKAPQIRFQKASQWCSITDELVQYLLEKQPEIHRLFRSGYCVDEMFIPTLLMNSPLRDSLASGNYRDDYRCCLRYIDWQRGNPYTFGEGDYEELIHTPPEFLFARKFDYARDPRLVERLFAHFGEEREN